MRLNKFRTDSARRQCLTDAIDLVALVDVLIRLARTSLAIINTLTRYFFPKASTLQYKRNLKSFSQLFFGVFVCVDLCVPVRPLIFLRFCVRLFAWLCIFFSLFLVTYFFYCLWMFLF